MQSAGFAARLARACHPLRPGWGLNRQHSFGRLALAHRASAKGRPASAGPTASSACSYSTAAGLRRFLRVSDEVAEGVASNKPVVALESTIYTHGAMDEDLGLENIVRRGGGIPAVCGILDGVPTVGLTPEELARMVDSGTAKKVSRRDISYMTGLGMTNKKLHGGTTVAGTMVLARLAGIRVFGTGGLGGVHRGGESTMDVSADLNELGRTRMAVVAAGCKGFLDIPRTLEYLETQGVFVATFADGRGSGPVSFPAFWARESGVPSPLTVESARDAAAMVLAQERLEIESGMLFANPIPDEFAVPAAEMRTVIETAVREAVEKGFTGANNTPYVLKAIRALTGDKSVKANLALVRANVDRATQVAVELSKLIEEDPSPGSATSNHFIPASYENKSKDDTVNAPGPSSKPEPSSDQVDVMVAGSVAVDLSCDYRPLNAPTSKAPQLETSNPAAISQSIGGVGHNVALAAHRISRDSRVRLCSLVGDDTAGSTVLSSLRSSGLDTTYIRQLGRDSPASGRTAQYVAVNDADKNLVLAMADMGIFRDHSLPEDYWETAVAGAKPRWLVVDGNWSPRDVRAWVNAGRAHGCKVAFEPVSTAKSVGLFAKEHLDRGLGQGGGVFPAAGVDLASPNSHELAAMWVAARENGYMETQAWWEVTDAFGIHSGARERFVHLTSKEITDAGVPVQAMQLLPYVPTIVTKLGSQGCLLTTILGRDDPRLRSRDEEPWILTRSTNDHPHVGGVYMRLFPAAERVEDVVSVNGVGDTFMGVLVAGLSMGGRVEKLIDVAQRGAVLTLKSHEAVSPDLGRLEDRLMEAVAASRR